MTQLIFTENGIPVLVENAAIPGPVFDLTPEETDALQAAIGRGATVRPDGDGWVIAEVEPEAALAAWRATAEVTRMQAKAALYGAGLLATAQTVVETTGGIVAIFWAEASVFRRASPTIAALQGAMGLTDEQLDDLFHAAAEIDA